MKLDTLDLRILAELQADGALSNVELARRVHLSPSPCLARVKAMEQAGVISRYVALASAAALGLGLNVFIRSACAPRARPRWQTSNSASASTTRSWSAT